MKLTRRSLLWAMVLALPASALLLLPLRAQEKGTSPAQDTSPPAPAAPAADTAPAPEQARSDELPPDERVSADNNLSFPVDI